MPTMIGRTGSDDLGEKRPQADISDEIFDITKPKDSPVVRIIRKLNKSKPKATTFYTQVQEDEPRYDTVKTTTVASSAGAVGTVTPDNPTYFRVGALILNETTSVQVLVTANDGTDLTVINLDKIATTGAWTEDDIIVIFSGTFEEGSEKPALHMVQPSYVYNLLCTNKRLLHVTRTTQQIQLHGLPELSRQQGKMMNEMLKDVEGQFFFGQREENNDVAAMRTYNRIASTGGIDEFIATNRFSSTSLAQADFFDDLLTCFRYGSDERYIVCSNKLLTKIGTWGLAYVQVPRTEETLGIVINKIRDFGGGNAYIINHPMLNENTASKYHAYAYCLDLKNIGYKTLQDIVLSDVNSAGGDYTEKQVITEFGFELIQEKANGVWYGIT